jgi:hypothetical protein
MKREVVQDFLNLPGIVGLALMDGRSRPYFYGIDQFLNFQQKEALAQGIRQVIATTPSDFNTFEFQFVGNQVHIYKLEKGLILLVMTDDDLIASDYIPAVKGLQATLKEDLNSAIATFRLFAGNATIPGQQYWNQKPPLNPEATKTNSNRLPSPPGPATSGTTTGSNRGLAGRNYGTRTGRNTGRPLGRPEGTTTGRNTGHNTGRNTGRNTGHNTGHNARPNYGTRTGRNTGHNTGRSPAPPEGTTTGHKTGHSLNDPAPPSQGATESAEGKETAGTTWPDPTSGFQALATITLQDCLIALNRLSEFARQYLGTAVIVNYWKSSRPDVEWLEMIQIERSGKIEVSNPDPSILKQPLTPQQQQWFQQWVTGFVKRCSVVIRDFPSLIKQDALDQTQQSFLLP